MMTINISELLTFIIYVGLIVLIVIFIVLGIQLIKTLKKVDGVIDDVNVKINKVNGFFEIIDKTTDYASSISDKVISVISSFVNVLLRKKKGADKNEEE